VSTPANKPQNELGCRLTLASSAFIRGLCSPCPRCAAGRLRGGASGRPKPPPMRASRAVRRCSLRIIGTAGFVPGLWLVSAQQRRDVRAPSPRRRPCRPLTPSRSSPPFGWCTKPSRTPWGLRRLQDQRVIGACAGQPAAQRGRHRRMWPREEDDQRTDPPDPQHQTSA
jgi:hypothetical protein